MGEYFVDRIEGEGPDAVAVLLDADGKPAGQMMVNTMPKGAREGAWTNLEEGTIIQDEPSDVHPSSERPPDGQSEIAPGVPEWSENRIQAGEPRNLTRDTLDPLHRAVLLRALRAAPGGEQQPVDPGVDEHTKAVLDALQQNQGGKPQ